MRRTPVHKKARYYRKVGGMAWHKERKHPFPTKSRKGVRQAASSADHWLPQTLCMGAFHHTLKKVRKKHDSDIGTNMDTLYNIHRTPLVEIVLVGTLL